MVTDHRTVDKYHEYEKKDETKIFMYHEPTCDTAFKIWLAKCVDLDGKPNPVSEVVRSIHRRKVFDKESKEYKEYLTWQGTYASNDKYGNPMSFPTGGDGCPMGAWDEPIFRISTRWDERTERRYNVVEEMIGSERHYDIPFSKENLLELRAKSNTPHNVGCCVIDADLGGIGGQSAPIAVHDFEDMISKPFDELCRIQRVAQVVTKIDDNGNASKVKNNK